MIESGSGILEADYSDQAALYEAFMPFLKGGGLFVRAEGDYELGDEVFVLVTLPDDPEPVPVAARIAWVTPVGTSSHSAGIGIEFGAADADMVSRIESQLADMLKSKKQTLTM